METATTLPPSKMPRLALRAAVFVFFLWMARGFLIPIATAAVFAILLDPWNHPKSARVGKQTPLLLTTLAFLGVIIPLTIVSIEVITTLGETIRTTPGGPVGVEKLAARKLIPAVHEMNIPLSQARAIAESLAARASAYASSVVTETAANIPDYLIDGFLFLVALYYFLRDGQAISAWILRNLPFREFEKEELFSSVHDTVRGAILGTMVTALVQSSLVLVALLALEIPGAWLWAIVAAVLSFTPVLGTAPVTMGATVYLLLEERWIEAAIMAGAAILVGVSDNVVRPWVTSAKGGLHPLLGLVGIFAGIEVFGPAGIFLGPVAAAMAIWTLDTYGNLRAAAAKA